MLPGTVVVHGTHGGNPALGYGGNRQEGQATVRYCLTPGTTGYGFILDYDGAIDELGGTRLAAWAHGYLNHSAIGVAFAQYDVPDYITPDQREAFRWLCRNKLAHVPRRLAAHELAAGYIEHRQTDQGRGFGKRDVGDKLRLMELLA